MPAAAGGSMLRDAHYRRTAMSPMTMMITERAQFHSASSAAPAVFVVDEARRVRASLERLIRGAGWQPHTFASARQFMAAAVVPCPSCLILDVALPDLSGLELQTWATGERPYMPVIFVTRSGDVRTTVQAMKAGAFEFLTKPVDAAVVAAAIGQAIERSRRMLQRAERLRADRESYASLTRREREVMSLVAAGLLNKQVGGRLGISEITVKAHRGQVMRKMKADSLPALVHIVARLGVATTPAA
jgi:FixJ family two-component response regulator